MKNPLLEEIREEGRKEGREEGRKEAVLIALRARFRRVPGAVRERVMAEADPAVLDVMRERRHGGLRLGCP